MSSSYLGVKSFLTSQSLHNGNFFKKKNPAHTHTLTHFLTPPLWVCVCVRARVRLCVCVTVCDSLFPPQYGRAPLHWAALKNSLEVAQVLLAHGADVNARDKVSLKANTCVYI